MGKLGKKKQQIQRRLAAAREHKKEVLKEVRSRLGGNKGKQPNEKRPREPGNDGNAQQKVKRAKGNPEGKNKGYLREVTKQRQQVEPDKFDDGLLQDIDVVKFGERVHAPPKLAEKRRKWGTRQNTLECVKALSSSKQPSKKTKKKSDEAAQRNALQKYAVEAYRAHQKQKSGKPTAGRATMESLKQLVKAEEERASTAITEH